MSPTKIFKFGPFEFSSFNAELFSFIPENNGYNSWLKTWKSMELARARIHRPSFSRKQAQNARFQS